MRSYVSSSGQIYKLNRILGEGGEGIVYELLDDDRQVAKIYKDTHFKTRGERDTTERKLRAMLSMNLSGYVSNVLMFTWPQDILYYNGTMVGYIMPRVRSELKIYSIYRMGNDVKKVYPNFTWKYSVQFAYNLAWVVRYLHSNGIVVGDFNQNNIYVDTNTSAVVLVDCDSFDVTDPNTGEHFPCTMGFSEVLAPELQTVGNMKNGKFTKYSDCFSLAIHIFRLLMKNADPFGGIITSGPSTSSIPQNQAIINGECQYVRNVGKIIPSWAPKLDAMPAEIRELFDKTFNYTAITAIQKQNKRATAAEWCTALLPYAKSRSNENLKVCPHNKLHVYPAHNKRCPWCVCEGLDYDPDTERIKKLFQTIPVLLGWLMIFSIIGEIVFLYQLGDDYQILWDIFCDNFGRIGQHHSPAVRIKYFMGNNQLIILNCIEQFMNLSIMISVLIERMKQLFAIAKDNMILYFGTVFEKIKRLIPSGGK